MAIRFPSAQISVTLTCDVAPVKPCGPPSPTSPLGGALLGLTAGFSFPEEELFPPNPAGAAWRIEEDVKHTGVVRFTSRTSSELSVYGHDRAGKVIKCCSDIRELIKAGMRLSVLCITMFGDFLSVVKISTFF